MTTPFGAACGDAVRLRGVWPIWSKNGKAKGILLAKIDPLDIRLYVDPRLEHGCDPLRVLCPVGLVHTREPGSVVPGTLERPRAHRQVRVECERACFALRD